MPYVCEKYSNTVAPPIAPPPPITPGGLVKVRLTEYYPFHVGLTAAQRLMEGGTKDRGGRMLYPLEDFLSGIAPYVSLACDFTGSAPGNRKEFKNYGYRVRIPKLEERFNSGAVIDFRLVDTGGNFFGDNKQIRVSGYEPIDVCLRSKPSLEETFGGLLTELLLVGN